ncbi:hypothetical protein C7271_21370 [filamentous cyanobacterium CCP5]|nr:hypothetical protein C7293_30085 [filamentous cyanobacterium CCT1]PSN14850.1 hypothetical protein C7271_21370 [filamentous cyanobacterium CCP5]PSN75735.1 hypothetical protein C8B47_31015 [filamentous cyanobacterium CCP4]
MNIKQRAARLGLIGLAVAMAAPAFAQTYSGNNVYKVTRSNGSEAVILANRSPGERISVTFPGAVSSRRVTANPCGLIVLRSTSTVPISNLLSVDGAAIDQTSLPTQLLPRCVDGTLEEARSNDFKTGAGEVVIVKSPNTVYEASFSGGRSRNVTANACGFASITSTSTYDLTRPELDAFEVMGSPYQISTLPAAGLEPVCRTGSLYVPAAW